MDVFYGIAATIAIVKFVTSSGQQAIENAKDYDRRGELANKMAEEKRKRDRAAARQKVKESEPLVYARMQAEQKARENKKSGWKIFGDDD